MLKFNQFNNYNLPTTIEDKKSKRKAIIESNKNIFISCNLCGKEFKFKSKYERFCQDCKIESELYNDFENYNGN